MSRQAVYDNIKRTEQMLEEYEEKLLLFQKFQARQLILKQLRELHKADECEDDKLLFLIDSLEKLE